MLYFSNNLDTDKQKELKPPHLKCVSQAFINFQKDVIIVVQGFPVSSVLPVIHRENNSSCNLRPESTKTTPTRLTAAIMADSLRFGKWLKAALVFFNFYGNHDLFYKSDDCFR